jgi:hypothetical protein
MFQSFNVFSLLHYTELFETFKFSRFSFFLRILTNKFSDLLLGTCHVHLMDLQLHGNTDALVL